MRIPTLHLNGSSKASLLDPLNRVSVLLSDALRVMQHDVTPNDRDYYPQGNGIGAVAREEHVNRMHRLESVLAEITELRDSIAQGGHRA